MLKTIVAFSALTLSSHAFSISNTISIHQPVTYQGGGTRKSPDGTQGKYGYTLTMTQNNNGFSFQDSLTVLNPNGTTQSTETSTFSTKSDVNDFFDVLDAKGNKIGRGYLYTINSNHFVHFNTDTVDVHSEVTWTFMKDKLYEMGSVHGIDNEHPFEVAYQGELSLVH